MHSTQALYDSLKSTLLQIESQIAAATNDAEKQIAVLPYPDMVTVYKMKTSDGRFVLTDLLVAKASVLSGMAALKAADLTKTAPRR